MKINTKMYMLPKVMIAIILVLCVLVSNVCNVDSTLVANVETQQINFKERIETRNLVDAEKVKFEGIGNTEGESANEVVSELNENENTKLIIELNNSFDNCMDRPDNDVSMAQVKELIRQQRARVKQYYTTTNSRILTTLNLSRLDVEYRADPYAPFIIAEFNKDITSEDIDYIYDLSERETISKIYVKSDEEKESELAVNVGAIGATMTSRNPNTNGSGVVIGILDDGIVDANNSNFNNISLTIRDEWYFNETVSAHATQVAAVALGVAPGADILSAETVSEPSSEIGWMLDNDVNIINMSIGYTNENEFGNYTSESAYCDYIARNNWVTFVGSAGNRGESDALVTAPNGYNVITVGSCDDYGELSSFSSYEENFNINFPNIVAPGEAYAIPSFSGSYSGTSYSAPLTAGAIAALMQNSPMLTSYPERVMSILMASTQRISQYATTNGFQDQVGTGMLNIRNALVAVNNCTSFSISTDNVGGYVSTQQVYLEKGDRIRVAFASIVNNENTVSTNKITDYDLYLFNPSDAVVARDTGTHNNEFIDYVATVSETYTIKIKQYSAKKTTLADYCSYTYFIA